MVTPHTACYNIKYKLCTLPTWVICSVSTVLVTNIKISRRCVFREAEAKFSAYLPFAKEKCRLMNQHVVCV